MKTISAILLALVLSTGPEWLTNFEAAREKAVSEHKLILLNFSGSDWCGPCIVLKKEVFSSEAFNVLAGERLVLLRADFPRQKKNQLSAELAEHNNKLAEKYNPLGKFPLTLLLDENGNVIRTWDSYSYGSQDKMMAELNAAVAAAH